LIDDCFLKLPSLAVRRGPSRAQQFALVLHELATNAAKYGSLSTPSGKLLIKWRVDGDSEPKFLFFWKERDGPTVEPPTQQGFGSKLVTATLPCEPKISFDTDGLEFVFEVPFSDVSRS
jgi:two-component sensor histidine kinase